MADVASTGGDNAPGGVAEAVDQSGSDTDLIPAERAARQAITSILGIDSDVLRDDTPLASIGWDDEAWLCLAATFTITDAEVSDAATFGDLVRCLEHADER
jgi:hypothetical protein